MKYRVQWNYKSAPKGVLIVLKKGQIVDYTEDEAAWFNRDCKGLLKPVRKRGRPKESNRQVKAAANRSE